VTRIKDAFTSFKLVPKYFHSKGIYTDQSVSKICNVTRRWACRLDGRKIRIYKIILTPFQNSQSGILRYKTVYSGRWVSTFLSNKPDTTSWESHSASVVQTISKIIRMPSLFPSWQSLAFILNCDFKNLSTISLWPAHRKPNIQQYLMCVCPCIVAYA